MTTKSTPVGPSHRYYVPVGGGIVVIVKSTSGWHAYGSADFEYWTRITDPYDPAEISETVRVDIVESVARHWGAHGQPNEPLARLNDYPLWVTERNSAYSAAIELRPDPGHEVTVRITASELNRPHFRRYARDKRINKFLEFWDEVDHGINSALVGLVTHLQPVA